MKKLSVFIVSLYILISSCSSLFASQPNKANKFIAHRVAHSGGAVDGHTYLNSYEALDHNIKKGFRYFEMDFLFTSDDQLVTLHDWDTCFKGFFGFEPDEPLTLEEFEQLIAQVHPKFTPCTLNGLAKWMEKNPGAYIVTDVKKGKNMIALKKIFLALPNAKRRVIPQIYRPEEFDQVKEIGFEQVIWTLYGYRFKEDNAAVLEWTKKFSGPFAVAMSKSIAKNNLPRELKKQGVPTYVHTVDRKNEKDEFVYKYGITEIYTSVLRPANETSNEGAVLLIGSI